MQGYSTVFLPGTSPSFVLKSASSLPRVIGLGTGPIRTMTGLHTPSCERGFVQVGSDVSQILYDMYSLGDHTE